MRCIVEARDPGVKFSAAPAFTSISVSDVDDPDRRKIQAKHFGGLGV